MSKKPIFKQLLLVCLMQVSGVASAHNVSDVDTEGLYNSGLAYYQQKQYEKAISDLETAVENEPEVAKYHHILAVSYGREAENVNWFKAMDYAKKTLLHLEKANELDPYNLEILDDLMDYYHEAPGFLGGDKEKGDKIQALIEKLTVDNEKSDIK